MLPPIIDFDVPDELKKHGISRIAKEAKTIVVHYKGSSIRSDILKDWTKTADSFEKVSKDIIIDKMIIQQVMVCLSNNWLKLCGYYHQHSDKISNNGVDKGNCKEDHANGKRDNNTADNDIIIPNPDPEKIPDRDYAKFVTEIAKKTVKCEDSLVRQIVYTGLSADSNEPVNLGIIAPTSEGKTYPIVETLKSFPKENVWLIGSMSTKLLVRQKGELVDQNNQPLKPQIKELKKQIEEIEDQSKIESLKEQLQELYENARSLIDLSGKILVFLEPPQHDLWNLLKPILSHDSEEIEFSYVDKTERGFQPKRVVVRGWPACIFCSAKDESNWPTWPEIANRFLITSPNMVTEKYLQSNILIAQRKGLPELLQQKLIVSNEEIQLAKDCILYLKQEIQKISNNKQNAVWIPYSQILGEILPSEKGTDTRVTKRIFSFLNIIALAKAHLRLKLIYGQETLIIAALEDLGEVLHITQNLNGMPTYKMKFFNEIFTPLYRSKTRPPEKHDNEESRIAVTTRELCDYVKEKTGKEIDTDNLKKKYLNELHNNGLIGKDNSVIDHRQKTYYPLVELPSSTEDNDEKISNCTNPGTFDNFLQYSKINIPDNCKTIPEDWLIYEILTLTRYRIDLDNFNGCIADFLNTTEDLKFFDKDGKRLTIRQFILEYEKNQRLSRYFVKRTFNNFVHKIFGNIKYIGDVDTEGYEKLSNVDKFVQFDNSMAATAPSIKSTSFTMSHTASKSLKSIANHQPVSAVVENRQQIEEDSSQSHPIQGEQKENDNCDKQGALEDYLGNVQTANELKGFMSKNAKTIAKEHNVSNKLFDSEKTNNLIYYNESGSQDKEQQPSTPSAITPAVDWESSTPSPQLEEQHQDKRFNCFYCSQAYSSNIERIEHIDAEHPGKMYYPKPEDFEKRLI
jgi:hypothetical protein